MIEILIIVCILETLLVLGCIVGLATEKDKRDRLEQDLEAHAIALNFYGDTVKYAVEQIGNIKRVYGDRLDMHRGELNELSDTIKIIDGVQDEELCFAEDTSNDLALLYNHLGLTIKTKEKKSGEITKKVVEA